MTDVVIRLRVTDDGSLAVFDQAGQKMQQFEQAAKDRGEGFNGLVKGATDFMSTIKGVGNILSQGAGVIEGLNTLGVSSLRAKEALNQLSGGNGAGFLEGMRSASKGLADDMTLAKEGAFALATGVVKSKSELADLTRIGSALGISLGKDVPQGMEAVTAALEHVGSKGSLLQLGVDAEAVMDKYNKLKGAMGDNAAWSAAFCDVAGKLPDQLSSAMG